MTKAPSPVELLGALLPWVNGECVSRQSVSRAIDSFVECFRNAMHDVWHVRVVGLCSVSAMNDTELDSTRDLVKRILLRGFPSYRQSVDGHTEATWLIGGNPLDLRFGTTRWREELPLLGHDLSQPPKLSQSQRLRREYLSPGAWVLTVAGAPKAVIPFLVLLTLTRSGMASISRCTAMKPGRPDMPCGNLLLTLGRGRPRKFCSRTCQARTQAAQARQREKEEAAEKGVNVVRRRVTASKQKPTVSAAPSSGGRRVSSK